MKKAITVIVIIVIALGVFAVGYFGIDYTNTNSKFWEKVTKSEFSMTIPKTMKEGSGYDTSTGQESVAYFSNTKAAVSISKIKYSVNPDLENIDLKEYFDGKSINGQKLVPVKVNDGYYATYTNKGGSIGSKKSVDVYSMEALFKGKDALYSVKVCCMMDDRKDYEKSMLEWLESFELS